MTAQSIFELLRLKMVSTAPSCSLATLGKEVTAFRRASEIVHGVVDLMYVRVLRTLHFC